MIQTESFQSYFKITELIPSNMGDTSPQTIIAFTSCNVECDCADAVI